MLSTHEPFWYYIIQYVFQTVCLLLSQYSYYSYLHCGGLTGVLDIKVNDIKQSHLLHLLKVPYNAKVNLKCFSSSAKLLLFINTTLDTDNNLSTGLSPYLFVATNLTIDHFQSEHRGLYSCVNNISTQTPERVLITSGELNV